MRGGLSPRVPLAGGRFCLQGAKARHSLRGGCSADHNAHGPVPGGEEFKLIMKTVLITGAARGLSATAEIFAENHYNIVLLDRDAPALPAAGERLPDALRLPIDIANPQAGDRCGRDQAFRALGLSVNTVGVADFGSIEACDATTWRRVMDTNLTAAFYLSQAPAAAPRNPRLSGQYRLDFRPARLDLRAAYGTSKAAAAPDPATGGRARRIWHSR